MNNEFSKTVSPEGLEVIVIQVAAGKKPQRIDVYLANSIENATRNKVQSGIEAGAVLVNGKTTKSSYKVAPFDEIRVTLPHPPAPDAEPEDLPIDIVYEDDDLLIINKAPGMVVHPALSNWTGTLVNALLHHVGKLSDHHDDPIRPGIVHRIDKDTSGLLVIAKNAAVHAKIAKDFARHAIEREYWAICLGVPKEPKGNVAGFIARDPRNRKRFAPHPSDGKWAVTHYEVIEEFGIASLVRCHLETGRTHQIRVHLNSIGMPILGDNTYGGTSPHNALKTSKQKQLFNNLLELMPRQALHAKTLGFHHPVKAEFVRFESDLPSDFIETLAKLRSLKGILLDD
ncbi:MAG: RluA family pseudouridine synthase [Bacteroidetes bacterium]|nr:RluA family pseudouridine synthase [Bacteroidota bacterium]